MIVLGEKTVPPLRARLVECDCGDVRCSTVFVVAQLVGSREELWLGMGAVLDGMIAAEHAADELLANPDAEVGFRTARQMVERGLALVGLEWRFYEGDQRVLETQMRVWGSLPEWMERLPAGKLWAVRKAVFGRELTRVPRALYAEDAYYTPDEVPQPRPPGYIFDQPVFWGQWRVRQDMPAAGAFADWSDA